MVSVGTATTVGVVTSARENRADMALKIPVVAELGQRVAVSRRIGGEGGALRGGGHKRERNRAPPGLRGFRRPRLQGRVCGTAERKRRFPLPCERRSASRI